MKFLNLTNFKFRCGISSEATKVFINADHIMSISVFGKDSDQWTVIHTPNGRYDLIGNVTKPIMYQLTGIEQ